MGQTLIAYVIVIVAAGWTGWTLFARGWFKRRAAAKAGGGCGSGCACGDSTKS